jgi:YD repeat-containing protein
VRFNDYGYDLASNLTSLQDEGGTTTYNYDAVNRPKTVLEPGESTAVAYRYDEDSTKNDTILTLPNGVTLEERVDKAGRLLETCARPTTASSACTSKTSDRLSAFLYSWTQSTPSGERSRALRQSVTDVAGNTTRYSYDELDRLTRAETKSSSGATTGHWEYGYDAASNLIFRQAQGEPDEQSAFNAANQLVDFAGTAFSYDKAGNETATGGLRTSSRYNSRGQVTRVEATTGDVLTREYAGPGQAERTQISDVPITYSALGISSFGATDPIRYARDPNGRLLSQRSAGGGKQYMLLDGIGSVRRVLRTSSPTVAWRRDFDPYGRPRNTLVFALIPEDYARVRATW